MVPDGVLDEFGVALGPQDLHHAVLVVGDGPGRHLQDIADFFHHLAFGQQLQHFPLPGGEEFGFIGFAVGRYVPLMVAMIATGAVGNWVGEVALLRTKEQHFRLVLQLALTILGLRLLWSAARGAGWF